MLRGFLRLRLGVNSAFLQLVLEIDDRWLGRELAALVLRNGEGAQARISKGYK